MIPATQLDNLFASAALREVTAAERFRRGFGNREHLRWAWPPRRAAAVEELLQSGCTVFPVQPKVAARYRERKGPQRREGRLNRKRPISQDELAGKMAARGITLDQTAISRIEGRARYVMDYEAAAIARCLNVSVSWLYGEE